MRNLEQQIKFTIEEKVSLEETVKQGEKAKEKLPGIEMKLKKMMKDYLEIEEVEDESLCDYGSLRK